MTCKNLFATLQGCMHNKAYILPNVSTVLLSFTCTVDVIVWYEHQCHPGGSWALFCSYHIITSYCISITEQTTAKRYLLVKYILHGWRYLNQSTIASCYYYVNWSCRRFPCQRFSCQCFPCQRYVSVFHVSVFHVSVSVSVSGCQCQWVSVFQITFLFLNAQVFIFKRSGFYF